MIKIILAEDHLVVRNGIKLLLDSHEGLEVVGEANNGEEVLRLVNEGGDANLVITDLTMEGIGGMELIRQLKQAHPSVKIIILSMLADIPYLIEAFDLGVDGYMVKNSAYDELLFAIQQVSNGGTFICAELTMTLLDKIRSATQIEESNEQARIRVDISDRESEILQLIGEGYTNLEIADKLFISKRTVEGHRQNLIDKLGVKNSAALIKIAVKNNLIR
ncbi:MULTISPECIES: response regulator [Sphingobacterium]|uniref:Response regulator n=1 Tax=Sphingobacterium populi TaxID=1812824 RepID=A0ABW5U9X9_9SPHI|nr:response regulator transcription factor [Sphingobacterium sp. CFCC 11742]